MLLGILALFCLGVPRMGNAQFVRHNDYAPNGPVHAITQSGNTIYLGGTFSLLGRPTGAATELHIGTGVPKTPYPRVVGVVRAVKPDNNGGWYLGGLFTSVQGQPRTNLAHLDANGNVTSWNPIANGEVQDIAVPFGGTAVYIAGTFTFVGGAPRNHAAALDKTAGLATPWDCIPDGAVSEIEATGNTVYLGGTFSNISGEPHNTVAAVHSTTAAPLPFPSTSDVIEATALNAEAGVLYYAVLTTDTPAHRLRRYDPLGTLPSWGQHTANNYIRAITVSPNGGVVVMGGDFTVVDGSTPYTRLAAVQVVTSDLLPPLLAVDGTVRALQWAIGIGGEKVLVGGSFTTVGGAPRANLAMLDWAGGLNAWNPGIAGTVWDIGDGFQFQYMFGGDFYLAGTVPRSNLAAIDAISGVPLDWAPATNATVHSLRLNGQLLYLGGQFTSVNGVARNKVACLDRLGGNVIGFNPNVDASPSAVVKAIDVDPSTSVVYIAGSFSSVGGVARSHLAAVDGFSGFLLSWNPGVIGTVNAIKFIPGTAFIFPCVVIGGGFNFAGGQLRNNLANIDGPTGLATSWNPNVNNTVLSMHVIPSPIGGIDVAYIGGFFTSVMGQPRTRVAAVTGLSVWDWNPNPNGVVTSIQVDGSTMYVGGTFTAIGGQIRNRLAALDLSSPVGAATPWNPNAEGGDVLTLLRTGGTVYAGGAFTTVSASLPRYFAGITDNTLTGVESDPAPDAPPLALRAIPNPFRFETAIQFSLASSGGARVTVYDVSGRRVRELHRGWLSSGRHTMGWDGRDDAGAAVASGIYFVGVRTDTERMTSKVYRQ